MDTKLSYPTMMADLGLAMRAMNRVLFDAGIRLSGHLEVSGLGGCNTVNVRMIIKPGRLHEYLEGHPELTVESADPGCMDL